MKRILLLSVFALIALATQAQLFKIGRFDIGYIYAGPKIGTNLAQISNWTEFTGVENKYRAGFQFGAVGEIGITNRFALNGEVTFISKGIKQTFIGGESSLNVKYLGIPLLAKYTFKFLGVSKIYAKGGTYTNIRTGGSYVSTYGSGQTFEEPLNNDGWTRVDWGMSIGAGAEYDAKYGIWGFDLMYDQGFIDVHKSDVAKNRNRSFGFALTYKYDVVDLFKRIRAKRVDAKAAKEAGE
jgi:hypothetical protein